MAMLAQLCASFGDIGRAAEIERLLAPFPGRNVLTADRRRGDRRAGTSGCSPSPRAALTTPADESCAPSRRTASGAPRRGPPTPSASWPSRCWRSAIPGPSTFVLGRAPILTVINAVAHATNLELVQVVVPPSERSVNHLVQLSERAVVPHDEPSPDGRLRVENHCLQLVHALARVILPPPATNLRLSHVDGVDG